jgi:hypothetical protein
VILPLVAVNADWNRNGEALLRGVCGFGRRCVAQRIGSRKGAQSGADLFLFLPAAKPWGGESPILAVEGGCRDVSGSRVNHIV